MTASPWRYWDADGRPLTAAVGDAVAKLEESMAHQPDHPGTNHLYIHIIESSPWPERPLPQADRLESLMPGAGHIVHMPAHIYVRTGRYRQAIESNRRSIAADERFLSAWGVRTFPAITSHKLSAAIHAWHAEDFIRYSAGVQGNYARALASARRAAKIAVDADGLHGGRAQLAAASVWLIHKMFGKWDALLAEPQPDERFPFLDGMIAYALGSAYLERGDTAGAMRELARVRGRREEVQGVKLPGLANSPSNLLRIAEQGLDGEIAQKAGDLDAAIASFELAVEIESRLRYIEPPDWPIPMRLQLGAALLQAEQPEAAERIFRKDLEWHQENGWGLHGLHAALVAQRKDTEAAEIWRRFERSWRDADIDLASPRGIGTTQ